MSTNRYYSKKYAPYQIQWKNFTDTSTPLSAANLQKSHNAIDLIDQSVENGFNDVDNTKLDKTDAATMITNVQYNQNTGVFTFSFYNGTSLTVNTNLEKIVVNFAYNAEAQKLELTQDDGTVVNVDLSDLIANPDLADSSTIAWTVNQDGSISADIINGSITDSKLEAGYLADITEQAANAATSEQNAEYYSKLAQSYANGTSNLSDRPNENVDNAKKYCELAEEAARQAGAVDMEGATATTDGAHGLVPKPFAGDQNKYLKGDGTWGEPEGAIDLIANVETSSISSHAYTIGQQFVLNGVLHIATAAISIGDAFVVGTNCAINQNITDQIKAIVDAYVTGVKGNSESTYRTGNVNMTKTNIGLGNVANIDQSKAIKSITRSGTTFTATALDGTTSTFTQKDDNTIYPYNTEKILDADYQTKFREETKGDTNSGSYIANICTQTANITGLPQFSAGLAFGTNDTHGYIMPAWAEPSKRFYVGGGSAGKLHWIENLMLGWKSISRSGTTFTVTRLDGSTFTFTQQDSNTTYSDFTGASASAAGAHGLVPAPAAGAQNYWLGGDKSWHTPQYMRNLMGLGNTTGVLPIANGGTGASSSYGGYIKCVAKSSEQITIAANSGVSVPVTISGESGWKFVGIVGYNIYNGTGGTGASSIFAYAITPDSTTPFGTASSVNINCNLRSVNTAQSKVYIQVSTLWIKA